MKSKLDEAARLVNNGVLPFEPEPCPRDDQLCCNGHICRGRSTNLCDDDYDFSAEELEQVENYLSRMRGGNLAYDNNRTPVR